MPTTKAIILLLLPVLLKTNAFAGQPVMPNDIGIEEELGKYVPLVSSFYDETGKVVSLKNSSIFHHCFIGILQLR